MKFAATMILDLLIVTDATHVVTVLELAGHADQEYLTVLDCTRVLAIV